MAKTRGKGEVGQKYTKIVSENESIHPYPGLDHGEGNDERQPLLVSPSIETETSVLQHQNKDNRAIEDCYLRSPGPGPPDSGWGWVICFAAFVETLVFDGVIYSFGIIFLELTDYFGSKKESGAWISSVNLGICMTTGPLSSALTNRFGFRVVAIAGTLIAVCGLITSCFATSIPFLYVSYGLVAGLGYGMVFSPTILAVTLYFDKKRSLATGLVLCGNGLGIFIMNLITELSLKHYSWRGTFLVHAGLMLNGIACGLVFLPLPIYNMAVSNSEDKTTHKSLLNA